MKKHSILKSPSPNPKKKYKKEPEIEPEVDSESDTDSFVKEMANELEKEFETEDEIISELEREFEPSEPDPESILDDFAYELETDFDFQSEVQDDIELKKLNLKIDTEMEDDLSDIQDEFTPTPKSTPRSSDTKLSPYISPTYQQPSTPSFIKYQGIVYNKIGEICYSYIVNKYRDRHECRATKALYLFVSPKEVKRVRPTFNFTRSFYDAVNSTAKIILIPYNLYKVIGDKILEEGGHHCLLIVNRYLNTIEFFDPNGYGSHFFEYGNKDYDILSEWIKPNFKNYKIYNFDSTSPSEGFQYYESLYPKESEKDIGGYCIMWSWFIADLRLNHVDTDFKHIQTEYIRELEQKYEDRLPEYLRKFIIRYADYVISKIKPSTPTSKNIYESSIEFDKLL